MNLIFFIHQDSSEKGTALETILNQTFKTHETQIFQTINAFKAKLKQVSDYNNEIFILLADSNERLIELSGLLNWMDDKRLLMILPDDSKTTMSMTHQFFPRYFTFLNKTYVDLCDVIIKMSENDKFK